MRRFDKDKNMQKANLLAETRYLKSKGLITEGDNKLSPEEERVLQDIMSEMTSLDEASFDSVLDKIKKYAKRGMLTVGIVSALLATPHITQQQSKEIKDVAQTEMGVEKNDASVQYSLVISKYLELISSDKGKEALQKLMDSDFDVESLVNDLSVQVDNDLHKDTSLRGEERQSSFAERNKDAIQKILNIRSSSIHGTNAPTGGAFVGGLGNG